MRIMNLLVLPCVFALVIACSFSWAGNKEIVEEQIEELDDLNKEVVEQIPDIPENGKIKLKSRRHSEGGNG